jgi:dethiobiotin synthase
MNNNKIKGFFITGTDTDIGKTYISRKLADSFSTYQKVTYMKPVQTGCFADENGLLIAPDFQYVMGGKAIMSGTLDQHVPYRFEPACSPHLAAKMAKQSISLDHIKDCLLQISRENILAVVEGAGGVLAPVSETTFNIDLILHLQLPVILVTSTHLGTLNHTFLSLKELGRAGAKLAGIVVNNCRNAPKDFIYYENLRMIQEHTRPVPFLEVEHEKPYQERINEFCKELYSLF